MQPRVRVITLAALQLARSPCGRHGIHGKEGNWSGQQVYSASLHAARSQLAELGLAAGDKVDMLLAPDGEPREADVPAGLAAGHAGGPGRRGSVRGTVLQASQEYARAVKLCGYPDYLVSEILGRVFTSLSIHT